jgi:2-oxoglutarate dehydrogenase E2 component (dihydrolipoamide succinyltransferase)
MSKFEVVMPDLGKGIDKAIIRKWLIKKGDAIHKKKSLLKITANEKELEIPSPEDGKVAELLHEEGSLVSIGEVIATITMKEKAHSVVSNSTQTTESNRAKNEKTGNPARKISPLVKNIAREENISTHELHSIPGSGTNGRICKQDVLAYLNQRNENGVDTTSNQTGASSEKSYETVSVNTEDEIAKTTQIQHMIDTTSGLNRQISTQVTSVVEADVTNIVEWRKRNKQTFEQREGMKLSYLPIFIDAVAGTLRKFPQMNATVDDDKIIQHNELNIGFAVSLQDGRLIYPVIRYVDQKNLPDIYLEMNRLVKAVRDGYPASDDLSGGTFSVNNFGSCRNVIGMPVINQPQVAILATGAIEKKPIVLETLSGDVMAIRSKMFVSLSYDLRAVDQKTGGAFIRNVADHLETFDINQKI